MPRARLERTRAAYRILRDERRRTYMTVVVFGALVLWAAVAIARTVWQAVAWLHE